MFSWIFFLILKSLGKIDILNFSFKFTGVAFAAVFSLLGGF